MSKKKKEKKPMSARKKLAIYKTFGYFFLICPLLVLLIIKRDKYFIQKSGLSVSFGLVILLITVILVLTKHSSFLKGIVGISILLVVEVCFSSIITDILPITACAWLGDLIYYIFFRQKIIDLKTQKNAEINAKAEEANTSKIVEAINHMSGRV